jgi:predicted dehydrogenase
LGWFGEVHCDAIIGISELTLSALSTRNAERLKDLASKYQVSKAKTDFMDVITDPDIDVIVVTTAWDKHKDAAIAALKAGKHVFLEKPITSTISDGDSSRLSRTAYRRNGSTSFYGRRRRLGRLGPFPLIPTIPVALLSLLEPTKTA